MYQEYFGLKKMPFSLAPDPAFLYLCRQYTEVISFMLYGIRERKGFLEITGEIGTGKTTLCRAVLNSLDPHTKSAYIFNSDLSEFELLKTIARDLGILGGETSKWDIINALNNFLLGQLEAGNNVVIIIDEAQNLKPEVLEQIRLLSNLETDQEKLLQIVLVGQPQLRAKLASPSLAQLRQRISIRYHLNPLSKGETEGYIEHRLRVAGSRGSVLFEGAAVDGIYAFSRGIPRMINVVGDKALLAAFVLERRRVTAKMVKAGIDEIEGRCTLDRKSLMALMK
ncbi:MAG: AAA family ATPase [Candidatus Tritonobacter lacicola]|nr:AAA family ATPase [Candidatus Tritonobacter lacicola]